MLSPAHKPVLFLVSDNGPDWNLQSLVVLFYLGRLWQELNLDFLVICMYAPSQSAFNMIVCGLMSVV